MKLNHFNFKEFKGKYLLTNDLGKYVFIEKSEFKQLVAKRIDLSTETGKELINAKMIYEGSDLSFSEETRYPLFDMKSHIAIATSLHIFVVTTDCNMNCIYCQATNDHICSKEYMSFETAEKAVDIALQSPEKYLGFEFQGGEPLLNFRVIKHIVEYTEENKGDHEVHYSVVSNLTLLTDEMICFFAEYHFDISTSIDGPAVLHNQNRSFLGGNGTYEAVVNALKRIRCYGTEPGAIETTTRYSLSYPKEIVRAYVDLGFKSIFIRHLTQLGKANRNWESIGYGAEEFLEFYRSVLDEIIRINKAGTKMREQHAAILLKRIHGSRVNYMELRSPCGGAIGQLAYYADGRIFTCDEGRMLAEMGNDAFLLGHVYKDNYLSIMKSGVCHTVCAASTLETIPSCCDCVYQPYCGTCPVVNYAVNNDIIEKSPDSFRCKIYKGILDYLFTLLMDNDKETISILHEWSS